MAKLTDHIEKEQSLQDYSRYVVKLLWRVIGKIDPEELSFNDKDALEDVFTFPSVSDIAAHSTVIIPGYPQGRDNHTPTSGNLYRV